MGCGLMSTAVSRQPEIPVARERANSVQADAYTPAAQGYRFISFDAPGGTQGTVAHHLNEGGTVTGGYFDANGKEHGFVRWRDGHLISFESPVPGSGIDPEGINGEGDVVGYYFDTSGAPHGFLRSRGGAIVSIDVSFPGSQGTILWAINTLGGIVGSYVDAHGNLQPFLRLPDGQFRAVVPAGSAGGLGLNITNEDVMTGDFLDGSSVGHGFIRQSDGSIITFDAPGAGTGSGQGTFVGQHHGVDHEKWITGQYLDVNNTSHGFLRERNGRFVSFDVPGGGVGNSNGAVPQSISGAGAICGTNYDSNGLGHGFVRHLDGSIVQFDAPGKGVQGTFGNVINSSGIIAGYWIDANGQAHGFIIEPKETPP